MTLASPSVASTDPPTPAPVSSPDPSLNRMLNSQPSNTATIAPKAAQSNRRPSITTDGSGTDESPDQTTRPATSRSATCHPGAASDGSKYTRATSRRTFARSRPTTTAGSSSPSPNTMNRYPSPGSTPTCSASAHTTPDSAHVSRYPNHNRRPSPATISSRPGGSGNLGQPVRALTRSFKHRSHRMSSPSVTRAPGAPQSSHGGHPPYAVNPPPRPGARPDYLHGKILPTTDPKSCVDGRGV
ncbi:hypothetical protein BMS3Bbin01_02054 [bacterium BMS3Bbin01]|nr:hypothetical protein BMS3Bbin01_02054 [bacterium BMS3Bbin01]